MEPVKVCKGNDIKVTLTVKGNNIHTFKDIKMLSLVLHEDQAQKYKHIPTTTATNQCCDNRLPISSIELKSLVTSSDTDQIIVEALFPADIQVVGGVYNVQMVWSEKTDDLISDNNVFKYAIDTNSFIEVVSNIDDTTIDNNQVSLEYIFKSNTDEVDNPMG